jgi:hypothetical protein
MRAACNFGLVRDGERDKKLRHGNNYLNGRAPGLNRRLFSVGAKYNGFSNQAAITVEFTSSLR